MRTKKQIAASRENGRKSRGATTADGQASIVAANVKSGMFAEATVLPWEQTDELAALRDEYYARHPPASPEARCVLDQVIRCEWQLRRFATVEDSLWEQFYNRGLDQRAQDPVAFALSQGDKVFARLQQRLNSTRRAFHTALKELERLQARDRDAVGEPESPTDDAGTQISPVNPSPEDHLQVLGSLRKPAVSAVPTAVEFPDSANRHLPRAQESPR